MSACCDPLSPSFQEEHTLDSVTPLQWLKLGLAGFVAAQTMVFSLAINLSPPNPQDRLVLHTILSIMTLVVLVLAGGPLALETWNSLKERRISSEQFFALGIVGALATSIYSSVTGRGNVYYEVVAVLVAIHTFGTMLSQRKKRQAIASANAIRRDFDTCTKLVCGGNEHRVRVKEIQPGDRVLVRIGEGIPIDGVIEEGVAFIAETAMTGEPFPVVKRPGDSVLAGAQALDQPLVIRSTTSGDQRQLDVLLSLVQRAQEKPSTIQLEADRIVRWFLPVVVVIALLTFAGWAYAKNWEAGMLQALTVIVVACPCAMGLATPIGLWNALSALSARGIIPQSGEWIERVAAVDTVVFDKTGTLSEEELRLVDLITVPGMDRVALTKNLAAAQAASLHPVARAFHSLKKQDAEEKAPRIQLLPGAGIEAHFSDGTLLQVGNVTLLTAQDDATSLRAQTALQERPTHEVFIRQNGQLVGLALLQEKFRESAEETIQRMESDHLQVEIMTGDRAESVRHLQLKHLHASLLPEDKARLVAERQSSGQKVLFVGDGVNDTAALAGAHAGLAMSNGATFAHDSANAVIFGGDLSAIHSAVRICRRAVGVIRQNLCFAIAYNLLGIGLAVGGVLHPVAASLLMFGSSISVTWNAMRLGESIRREGIPRNGQQPAAAQSSSTELRPATSS